MNRRPHFPPLCEREEKPLQTGPFAPENRQHSTSMTLEELEKRHIEKVLEIAGGNRLKAAKILGVNVSTVYRKIEKYNLGHL